MPQTRDRFSLLPWENRVNERAMTPERVDFESFAMTVSVRTQLVSNQSRYCEIGQSAWAGVTVRNQGRFAGRSACAFAGLFLFGLATCHRSIAGDENAAPHVLTLVQAVSFALQNNPELAAIRQQHGIAAAGVVIARTYPLNPVLENRVQASSGPISAGITNRVPLEHLLLFEVEMRGQGTYRRQGALAALSRTDWEIAYQEELLAIRVIRAFAGVIYRQEKLKLIQETIDLDRLTVEQLSALRRANAIPQADLILARTEEDDARAQLGSGRVQLAASEFDLRRTLGLVNESVELQGRLEVPLPNFKPEALTEEALDRRADLHARQMAISEADARLQLEIANRMGNPVIGPAYTYDPTRVNEIGGQLNIPLPLFNRRRGEIQQREAERALAALQLRQTEVAVRQDVQAALARLQYAQATAAAYGKQTIPNLQAALREMQNLFEHNQADIVRLIDVRRKLLRGRDSYLDALLEVRLALADLAAAVGETSLSLP
jgi:cobalt-zinc-cadmium efflux system outer membrane protein